MNNYDIDKIEKILYNIDKKKEKNYEPITDIEFIYFILLISVFDYKKYFKKILNLEGQYFNYYDVD